MSELKSVRIPGRRLALPSKGALYTVGKEINEELKDGEVTITPLTTRDEMLLSSIDDMISGEAVRNVLLRRIKEIEDPLSLYYNDVVALLGYLKMVSYGNSFPMTYKHSCTASDISIDINLEQFINDNITYYDPTLKNGLELVYSDCTIYLDLPRYFEQLEFIRRGQVVAETRSADSQYQLFVDMLTSRISAISIDNKLIKDKDEIKLEIEDLPSKIVMEIYDVILSSEKMFGISTQLKTKCNHCGEDVNIDIPIDPSLFF